MTDDPYEPPDDPTPVAFEIEPKLDKAIQKLLHACASDDEEQVRVGCPASLEILREQPPDIREAIRRILESGQASAAAVGVEKVSLGSGATSRTVGDQPLGVREAIRRAVESGPGRPAGPGPSAVVRPGIRTRQVLDAAPCSSSRSDARRLAEEVRLLREEMEDQRRERQSVAVMEFYERLAGVSEAELVEEADRTGRTIESIVRDRVAGKLPGAELGPGPNPGSDPGRVLAILQKASTTR